jgi:dihydrofolate synthase/folylpolyglutamate synthase
LSPREYENKAKRLNGIPCPILKTPATRKPDTSYEEARRFLLTFTNFSKLKSFSAYESVAADIADFRSALRRAGDPHLRCPVIHVVGSKAKGSTCSMLAEVLQQAGFRTGLLTSPHLCEYTERIRVNGEEISADEFGRLIALWRQRLPDGTDPVEPPGWQKLLQALHLRNPRAIRRHYRNNHAYENGTAFEYFSRLGVEFTVIETGMGGRLDHTNVFDSIPGGPDGMLLSVVTTIAHEHTVILGETISAIAEHKAGIIQPFSITVLGPQQQAHYPDVLQKVQERQMAVSAPPVLDVNQCIFVEPGSVRISPRGTSARFSCDISWLKHWLLDMGSDSEVGSIEIINALKDGIELSTPLIGRHQAENLRTILGCAIALGTRGFRLSLDQLKSGLSNVVWPARFEIISNDPLAIVDCCHEPLSIRAFTRTFREFYRDRPVIAVISFLRDNDIPEMCRAIKENLNLKHVICCWAPVPVRAMHPAEAAQIAQPILDTEITLSESPPDAIQQAVRKLEGNDALLVFCDFYIAGITRKMLPQLLNAAKKKEQTD